MHTQMLQSMTETQLTHFQKVAIQKNQLQHIKGGDSDTPPDDSVIGVEDIIGG